MKDNMNKTNRLSTTLSSSSTSNNNNNTNNNNAVVQQQQQQQTQQRNRNVKQQQNTTTSATANGNVSNSVGQQQQQQQKKSFFNPKLITSQIIALQCFHYSVLCICYQCNHVLFGTSITIDRIFTDHYIRTSLYRSGSSDMIAIILASVLGYVLFHVVSTFCSKQIKKKRIKNAK